MRPKSVAVTAFACAALLASLPAVTRAQTTTTGTTTTQTAVPNRVHVLVYGKITELAADHVTIKPDNATAKRIRLIDSTRYVARSFAAAREGLQEGEYAAAIGLIDTSSTASTADADNVARRIEYDTKPFRQSGSGSNISMIGVVVSSGFNSLTVRQQDKDPVIVKYTQNTKFFVNGKLVQNPPTFKGGETVWLYVHREPDDSLDALRVAVRMK